MKKTTSISKMLLLWALTASSYSYAGPAVTLETNRGDIVLELNDTAAPITTANFLGYVKSGFYDGLIFHRVIPNFMIQGGGFTPDMTKKSPNAPIKNESDNGLANVRGSIAMARLRDPDSATNQFFINLKNNSQLDGHPSSPGYAVFGKVTQGMEVVDAIAATPTTTQFPYHDVPKEPVIIKKAFVNAE